MKLERASSQRGTLPQTAPVQEGDPSFDKGKQRNLSMALKGASNFLKNHIIINAPR